MKLRNCFVLTLIVCISIIQISATNQHQNNDVHHQFKRIFFNDPTTTLSPYYPSGSCASNPCEHGGKCLNVQDDYRCECTNGYDGKNCQTKFNNLDKFNNNCRPYICNTGRCVSLKTTYYCQCPDDRYGEHCEKRIYKQSVSKRQTLYQLLKQLKRTIDKQNIHDEYDNDERAYYDFKNGIYF